MDGVLVRDLQLRPTSKFAFLLRPLPARAAQLDSYATYFRRRILRVIGTSKAKKRCAAMDLHDLNDKKMGCQVTMSSSMCIVRPRSNGCSCLPLHSRWLRFSIT